MLNASYMLMIYNCIHLTVLISLNIIWWLLLAYCIIRALPGICRLPGNNCFICTVSNVYHNLECSSKAYGICNQIFANVHCVRDIGVMVDFRLKFYKQIAEIVHKAMSRANVILKSFHSSERTLLTTAFCTYVRPLVLLSSMVPTHSVL